MPSFCETTCFPGPKPTWTIPDTSGGPERVVWVDPADVCSPTGSICNGKCDFVIGPEVPGVMIIKAGPPVVQVTTTLPYEIIKLKPQPSPIGKSMVDYLGYATELLQMAASKKGIRHGLCVHPLRPPCSCGCAPCVCGVRISRTWLPSDTHSILSVKIDGVPLPEFVPGGVLQSIVVAPGNGTAAIVTGEIVYTPNVGFIGKDTLIFNYLDPDGTLVEKTGTAHIGTGLEPFSTLHAAGGPINTPVRFVLQPRRQWRMDDSTDGRWLIRLDPSSSCEHRPGACSCSDGRRPQWQWPRNQRIDLPDTLECTWSVTVLTGCEVPQIAQKAVVDIACDMVKNCIGQECEMPENIASLVRGGAVISYRAVQELTMKDGQLSKYESVRMYLDYAYRRQPISHLNLFHDNYGYVAPFPTRVDVSR